MVEGGTYWLGVWALARPRPLLRACAAAFVLAAGLFAAWAAWHGGVPEFSELGWI